MNKKRVNEWIPRAKEALEKAGIAENNTIDKTFRGQISSFGAAITMGSLTAAVAFFSQKGSSQTDRHNLLLALDYIIHDRTECRKKEEVSKILDDVLGTPQAGMHSLTAAYIDASIALKLAMNYFDMTKKDGAGNA